MPSKRTNDSVDRILEELSHEQAERGIRDSVTDRQVDAILQSLGHGSMEESSGGGSALGPIQKEDLPDITLGKGNNFNTEDRFSTAVLDDFRALKKKNSGNIVSYTLATIVGLFLMLDSSLQPPVLNTKADKHLAPVIEKKFDTSKLYSYMSVDMLHFFSLNFYLGDKIQQFDKVLPQDGVLMIPEEDMPDFLEKFGKDYTFQKVWEVRKTVEWHNKVGFYRFVKTSANIALNK